MGLWVHGILTLISDLYRILSVFWPNMQVMHPNLLMPECNVFGATGKAQTSTTRAKLAMCAVALPAVCGTITVFSSWP